MKIIFEVTDPARVEVVSEAALDILRARSRSDIAHRVLHILAVIMSTPKANTCNRCDDERLPHKLSEYCDELQKYFAKQRSIIPDGRVTLKDEILLQILSWHSSAIKSEVDKAVEKVKAEAVGIVNKLNDNYLVDDLLTKKQFDEATAEIKAIKGEGK